MRLFDIVEKHLPRQAGKATIRWSTSAYPARDGSVITLRLEENGEFIPLKDGEQFLYLRGAGIHQQRQVFFGGTDENPFLTELDPSVRNIALVVAERGESIFYDALKPEKIKHMELGFGVQSRRQGDIFAVPVDWTWERLRACAAILNLATGDANAGKLQVFGTRHVLEGRWLETVTYYKDGFGNAVVGKARTLFAMGTLKAPDHSPLVLKGIHVLAQVGVLARPREAD